MSNNIEKNKSILNDSNNNSSSSNSFGNNSSSYSSYKTRSKSRSNNASKTSNKNEKSNATSNSASIRENDKRTKKLFLLLYFIPLVLLIIIAIIYIPSHNNILLIPFAILMFIVLFGHDGSVRTCPHCKKWNSVIFTETKNVIRTKKETVKNVFGKEKIKENKIRLKKYTGECQNCGFVVNTEKKRLF